MSLSIAAAQRDVRFAYYGGGPGMGASAAAWLAAALVAVYGSPDRAVVTLFAGGVLIHPVGVLLTKALGRPGAHTPGNPLGVLAMETTVLMILALPLAYVVSRYRLEWFFPAMLPVIGGRYLTFATIHGLRVYWACGATLAAAAYALVVLGATPAVGAFTGAALEAGFAALIMTLVRGEGRDGA